MRFLVPSAAVLALAFAARAPAATLVVDPLGGGGAFTDLQLAIDAAQPGDVIKIVGGSWRPIVVDKPLQLVGAPMATIEFAPLAQPDGISQRPAIELRGPGAGKVLLHGLRTAGIVDGSAFQHAGTGLAGRGFDEVLVEHCALAGAKWQSLPAPRAGASGVSVRLPYLVVSHSVVCASTSGGSDDVQEHCQENAVDGVAGLNAQDPPGGEATVLLLDSFVDGGDGSTLCFWKSMCFFGQHDCPSPAKAGKGGPGLVARHLFTAGSTVLGGKGGGCTCSDPYVVYLSGSQSDGPPLAVTTSHAFAPGAQLSAPLAMGQTATVSWPPSPPGLLFVALGTVKPLFAPGAGWFALDPSLIASIVPLPAGPAQFGATVPMAPQFLGAGVALQAYDPAAGLTSPSVDALFGGEWSSAQVASADTPKAMATPPYPTPPSVLSSVTVAGMPGVVEDVEISVDVSYPSQGSLQVILTHPDGTQVLLADTPVSFQQDLQTTYPLQTDPAGRLDALDGKPANGLWRLTVFGLPSNPPQGGTLNGWTLRVVTVP